MKKIITVVAVSLGLNSVFAAPLCPASQAVNQVGIGDGCTVPSEAGWLFPNVSLFKDDFTPACHQHDKCYTTLGTSYDSCNSHFYSQMRATCDKYEPRVEWKWYGPVPKGDPVKYLGCKETALQFYEAVKLWASRENPLPRLHADALRRSQAMEATLAAGSCEAVPESTTLFTDALIAKVNNNFLAQKGRLPTTLEFFRAINYGGNFVTNPAAWDAQLRTVIATSQPRQASERKVIHRYYQRSNGAHFYTDNWQELQGGKDGYVYEGNVGYLATHQTAGTRALLRYFNTGNGDHFYTTDWHDLGFGGAGWQLINIVGFCESSSVAGTHPLHRYYSGQQHFYTPKWSELEGGSQGFIYEGVACHTYADVTPWLPTLLQYVFE